MRRPARTTPRLERLGDRMRHWVTVNEPWCSAYLGYCEGMHAPGIRDDAQGAVDAGHHLLLAHGLAAQRIRQVGGASARVGAALNLFPIFAGDAGAATVRAVERAGGTTRASGRPRRTTAGRTRRRAAGPPLVPPPVLVAVPPPVRVAVPPSVPVAGRRTPTSRSR